MEKLWLSFVEVNNVSRGTLLALDEYITLLKRFSQVLNIISLGDIDNILSRHILDSAQIVNYITKKCDAVVDVGSGGGFPGIVLAIMLKDRNIATPVYLVESSKKKCAFLSFVVGVLGVNAYVVNSDIRKFNMDGCLAVVTRGVGTVLDVVGLCNHLIVDDTLFLFLKGRSVFRELDVFLDHWYCDIGFYKSISSCDGFVVELRKLYNVKQKSFSR